MFDRLYTFKGFRVWQRVVHVYFYAYKQIRVGQTRFGQEFTVLDVRDVSELIVM
jgi:hypothetical protein